MYSSASPGAIGNNAVKNGSKNASMKPGCDADGRPSSTVTRKPRCLSCGAGEKDEQTRREEERWGGGKAQRGSGSGRKAG